MQLQVPGLNDLSTSFRINMRWMENLYNPKPRLTASSVPSKSHIYMEVFPLNFSKPLYPQSESGHSIYYAVCISYSKERNGGRVVLDIKLSDSPAGTRSWPWVNRKVILA